MQTDGSRGLGKGEGETAMDQGGYLGMMEMTWIRQSGGEAGGIANIVMTLNVTDLLTLK